MKEIEKINTNYLRTNLSTYLAKRKGYTIYITRYNKLVAELRIYTNKIREEAELRIAKKMIEAEERENWS